MRCWNLSDPQEQTSNVHAQMNHIGFIRYYSMKPWEFRVYVDWRVVTPIMENHMKKSIYMETGRFYGVNYH